MNTDADKNRRNSELGGLQKYGMLLMGIFLIILSGGRFVTPAAAFLAPIFLLRFTRNSSLKFGMAVLYMLLFLSLLVRLHDYFAVPRPLNLLFIAGLALFELLPFLADRTLRQYLPTFLRPLVLPAVFVVLGFALSTVLPFGTMGERAYSQSGNSELMQLLAVTGTHGVTFVVFWFAATMASLWDSGFVWQRNRSQVAPLAICLMIIFVAGGFRLIFDENESPTVRISGVVGDQVTFHRALQNAGVEHGLNGLVAGGYDADKLTAAIEEHQQSLFKSTATQAQAGASIVSWAEAGAVVFKHDESRFVELASNVAEQNSIYLVTSIVLPLQSVGTADADNKVEPMLENKLIVFAPTGEVLGQYVKARSLWSEAYIKGNGEPLIIETPHGKIAFSIGFDMDFPPLLRKAGGADIVIAPSSDWKTLSPHHSVMATFRGVENGVSVFRPTANGTSFASDSHGRTLARTDHFRTALDTFIADVPTSGVTTIYTRAGDWFGWVNIALLLLLVAVASFSALKRKKRMAQTPLPTDPDEVRDRSRITAIQWREAERDNNLHRNN